jgi:hypothetical protein
LARHSITRAPPLALDASDSAAEMASPEAAASTPGKQADWWRNLRPSAQKRSAETAAGHKA